MACLSHTKKRVDLLSITPDTYRPDEDATLLDCRHTVVSAVSYNTNTAILY